MKKKISIFLALALTCAALAGCGSSAPAAPAAAPAAAASEAAPAAEAKPDKVYNISFALWTAAGGVDEQAAQEFGRRLTEKTNGGITLDTFAGCSLGTEQENLDQLKSGEIEMMLGGDVFTSQILGEYNATLIPFAFDNIDEVISYWEGLGDVVTKKVKDEGNMKIIARVYRAPRQLTSNKLIQHPEDLKDFKLRIPEIPFYLTVWGGLGANPTPVNFAEVYTALQTGVCDGQENPIETYVEGKFYEVQPYTAMTNHIFTFQTWIINDDFFNGLPEEYQKIVLDTAAEVAKETNDGLWDRQDGYIKDLTEQGHTFTEIDIKEFQEAARPYIKECADTLTDVAKQYVYDKMGF